MEFSFFFQQTGDNTIATTILEHQFQTYEQKILQLLIF